MKIKKEFVIFVGVLVLIAFIAGFLFIDDQFKKYPVKVREKHEYVSKTKK